MIKANCQEPASSVGGLHPDQPPVGNLRGFQMELSCLEAWHVCHIPADMDPKEIPFLPSPLWELERSTSRWWENGQFWAKELPCGPRHPLSHELSEPLFFLCEMGF